MAQATLYLTTNGNKVIIGDTSGERGIEVVKDGEVLLKHNNNNKLQTTSTGINVTGAISSGAITSTGNSRFNGDFQVGDTLHQNSYGALQVNQTSNVDEEGIAVLSSGGGRSIRIWVDETNSYINSGNGGSGNLILNEAITVTSGGNLTGVGTIASNDITITDTSFDPFLKLATSERQYVVRIDNDDSDKFQIRDVTAGATRLSIDSTGLVTTVSDARVF